jgi:hypothetical protein
VYKEPKAQISTAPGGPDGGQWEQSTCANRVAGAGGLAWLFLSPILEVLGPLSLAVS